MHHKLEHSLVAAQDALSAALSKIRTAGDNTEKRVLAAEQDLAHSAQRIVEDSVDTVSEVRL